MIISAKQRFAAFLVTLLFAHSSYAEITGFAAIDTRIFINAPSYNQQKMNNGPTFVIEPEYYNVTENQKNTFTARPFMRIDSYDNKRTHFDIRQLDWLYVKDDWELRSGISKVFWGVTESNHLVDIINQTDVIEDIDGEDKLGQPMVQLGILKAWGNIRLYYLPYFRERTFASIDGRLRSNIPVEDDNSTYDAGNKEWHPDFAIRYAHAFGNWDLGLSHFSGTSREPRFTPSVNADGQLTLVPHYDLIDQTATDIQYTNEGWLLKLEAMTRTGHGRRFAAVTSGVEYTLYSILDSDLDLGLLAEYQFDDRSSNAPSTFADNDVFLGTRLTFNDTQDTSLLAGTSVDNNTQGTLFLVEAQRRIGNNWRAEITGQFSSNIVNNAPEASFRKDDHFTIRFARYF